MRPRSAGRVERAVSGLGLTLGRSSRRTEDIDHGLVITNDDSRIRFEVFFAFNGEAHPAEGRDHAVKRASDDPVDVFALADEGEDDRYDDAPC